MDNGPFRVSRSADRSDDNQEEGRPTEPPVKEPKPIHHRPASSSQQSMRMKQEKSKKPLIIAIAAVVIVIVVAVGVWAAISNSKGGVSGVTGIDNSKYQAVFFTNGQVYFGKLQSFNDEYMKLKDVYYLQAQEAEEDPKNPQKTAANENDVQLIKLGDEIHGPQDEMIISKDQILFYENLKSDGKVSSSIEQYNSSNK